MDEINENSSWSGHESEDDEDDGLGAWPLDPDKPGATLNFVEDPETMERPMHRGAGQIFPDKFIPPDTSITPLELFSARRACGSMQRLVPPLLTSVILRVIHDPGTAFTDEFTRMAHRDDDTIGLIFTDGACLNNGQEDPKAGWAIHHGFSPAGKPQVDGRRLEQRGPFDTLDQPARVETSNRAELRAVLGALRLREWKIEGFKKLVLATDSSYVVDGATAWCRTWRGNGWRTQARQEVKNKDLWEMLLGEVEDYKAVGIDILFWHIPRELNTLADEGAKEAAATRLTSSQWVQMCGIVYSDE